MVSVHHNRDYKVYTYVLTLSVRNCFTFNNDLLIIHCRHNEMTNIDEGGGEERVCG